MEQLNPIENINFEDALKVIKELKSCIENAIFGQTELVDETMASLLAGGHILMTGAPGLAKTTLIRVFASYLKLRFGRIQFTPDLLPSDIIGSDILNIEPDSGRRHFEFSPGPIFVNLLLADEINRASPRTQSALLEAMQERSITVSGKFYELPQPFIVLATQNPFESEGTFPLPEAQMDRFLLHTLVEYPEKTAEEKILIAHSEGRLVGEAVGAEMERLLSETRFETKTILSLQQKTRNIRIEPEIVTAINELVRSTRPSDELCPKEIKDAIWYGASPRAGISLISAAKAFSLLCGQETVRWKQVKRAVKPALRHRIKISLKARREMQSEDRLIEMLLTRLEEKYKNLAQGN